MEDAVRECFITAYVKGGLFYTTESKLKVTFHSWGTVLFDKGIITVAIVENVKGKIYCVPPDYLEFITANGNLENSDA